MRHKLLTEITKLSHGQLNDKITRCWYKCFRLRKLHNYEASKRIKRDIFFHHTKPIIVTNEQK